MADADVAGPPGNLSGGGNTNGNQGGSAPSVGPGTGRNENNPARGNPARGVSFDGVNLSGLMGGITGMLGFDPSAPAVGVTTETDALRNHPDEGLFGIQSSTLTDPGYSKAVDKKGKALSANKARQRNLYDAFPAKAKELREQLEKEHKKEKKDWGSIRELNKALQAIEQSNQYSKAMAMNNPTLGFAAKALAGLFGMGTVATIGPAIESFAIEHGLVDDTTPQDVIDADPSDNAPEGQTTEEQTTNIKDSVEGGFWGLLGFAKNNPKIFGPLSGEELWRLVMDEDAFWNYYEQGLLGG